MEGRVVISLVAPVYGVEKYIGRFAESVLGQSYPFIQFIFVNDGTKDSSMQILNSLIDDRYSHLKDRIVIVEKENEGLPAARKTGMEYVTGDYVWHIDSDDWLEEDAAGRIAECAMKTEADLIYFNFYKEYDGKTRLQVENDYSGKPKDVYQRDMFNHKAYGCTWNKCVKRSLYLDNDIYFPQYSYAEDICLMAQLVGYADKIAFLDAPLYHYRKNNPDSVTRQYRRERCREAAMNLMSLYCHYGVESNPAAPIFDDVFYKVGFYSAIYDFNFFDRYAFLADKILEAKMLRRSYIGIHLQLILKIYAFFRSRR